MKIWAIADSKRQGFLGFGEFVTAMQVYMLHSLFPFILLNIIIGNNVELYYLIIV